MIVEAMRRLVDFHDPDRVSLFDSEARAEAGIDSDLDFPDDTPDHFSGVNDIYTRLAGLGAPKDVLPWWRNGSMAAPQHVAASLPAAVVQEGGLLYDGR